MTRRQFSFPVFICARVAPFQNTLQLFVGPSIKVDGFDSAYMGAHPSVDA
jgi:hypothetical protein